MSTLQASFHNGFIGDYLVIAKLWFLSNFTRVKICPVVAIKKLISLDYREKSVVCVPLIINEKQKCK